MQKFDVLIVGGGMVGLTAALAIRKQSQFKVAIVDTQACQTLTEQPELRVSAINAVSQQLFANLAVWPLINAQRLQAYQHMHIWDKSGYGQVNFDVNDLDNTKEQQQLGWIIENNVIRNALWEKARQDSGISFFSESKLANIAMGESEVFASFSDNSQAPIMAKLVVGADGAHSWVREQMQMKLSFRDYDHHAIVATIECSQSHQNTAWQVFLPEGPLAFLPLYKNNLCSIVWSTTPEQANKLTQLSAAEFSKQLTSASDGKLGKLTLKSELCTFPLTMRLAQQFNKDKVVLVGDAAHTIHPLAGQGVNLGLLDAAALAQVLSQAEKNNQNSSVCFSEKLLNDYHRWRKSEAAEMIAAMEVIKQSFTPQQPLIKFLRGMGMSLLNRFSPAKKLMIAQALGYKGQAPNLTQMLK